MNHTCINNRRLKKESHSSIEGLSLYKYVGVGSNVVMFCTVSPIEKKREEVMLGCMNNCIEIRNTIFIVD